MKRILTLTLLATIMLCAACDKIDDKDMLRRAGAIGTWYDDNQGVADHSQRAFLEKYTGCRCINCPTADDVITEALANYGGRLIAVAVHTGSYAYPFTGEPDLRTEVGTIWNDHFLFNSYPVALLNRTGEPFVPTTNFNSRIDGLLSHEASLALAAECTTLDDGSLDITSHLEFLKDVSGDLTITLLIMEDGIVTSQKMPDNSTQSNYVQNHVLRDVITSEWGNPVDADGKKDTRRYVTFNYETKDNWNLDRCHIVVFVSNKDTKEILNVCETKVR